MNHYEFSVRFMDHLLVKYEHWIMDHGGLNPEIEKFVNWCREEEDAAIHAKRAPDGKSFYERHQESKPVEPRPAPEMTPELQATLDFYGSPTNCMSPDDVKKLLRGES